MQNLHACPWPGYGNQSPHWSSSPLIPPMHGCPLTRVRRRSAFSLTEMLIVIGIIGLLIAVLLPALAMSRASARRVACMNNMRNLGIGGQAYATNNGGVLPWE